MATSVLPKPTSPHTRRSIGFGRQQVLAHRVDGGLLVRRFLEGEPGGEGFVVDLRVLEGIALARGAAGVDVEQFCSHVAHLLGGLALGFLPGFRAELVQWRQGVVAAGIAGDQMQAGDRHVEFGLVSVLQQEEFLRLAFDFEGDQPLIAADPMIDMHHRRAFAQLGEVLDDVVAAVATLLAPPALHDALAEQRAFRDQGDFVQQQAFVERGDGDRQALLAGEEPAPAFDFLRAQLQARQQLQQHFAAPRGLGGEQHAPRKAVEELAQLAQWLAGLGFDRQFRQGLRREALAADAGFHVLLAGNHARPQLEPGEAVFHRHEQLGRRQQRALGVDAALLVAIAHVIPELLGGLLDAGQGKHLAVFGQIVEEGCRLLIEKRQVVFDTGGRDAGGQVLVDRAAAEVDVETLAETCAEAGDRFLFQRKFPGWQQTDRLHLVDGALILRIESAQGFDLVIEQVDTVGQGAAHGEQIDQRATHGKLAMFVDRVHAAIAGRFQTQAHLLDIQLLPNIQHQARTEQKALGRQPV